MRCVLRPLFFAALVVLPLAAPGASAQPAAPLTPLRIGVFAQNLPMLAGNARGFFAAEGLAVQFLLVSGSVEQFQSVGDGAYDLIHTSPDNVATYRLNRATPVGGPVPTQAILSTDRGAGLRLVARPGLTSAEDLRGQRLGVDAPDSGFAFVLYAILAAHGLTRDVDYAVVPVGGVLQRYNALRAGEIDGTLLSNGFEIRLGNEGYTLLEPVQAIADPYLGSVIAAPDAWLAAHPDLAVRFARAYLRGLDWSLDSANRGAAEALLAAAPDTPPELASQLYQAQVVAPSGLVPGAEIAAGGLLNVLRLRAANGGFERTWDLDQLATPAGGLYDASYLAAAKTAGK